MTRDNHNKSNRTQSPLPSPNEDSIIDLPDLSAFPEDEKRHILGVLVRNEDLRNKHLARFMNLRKEVAELEEQSTTASPSVCARCQTPFRFVFNTGDACPKCSAKVCKQCRLMYNGNDNSWLCQLCCKQMQLMSYSGEWIYALHSNLRKGSRADSEDDVFSPPSISRQNINGGLSSSDSDADIPVGAAAKPDRFRKKSVAVVNTKSTKPEEKGVTMIVQNARDLKKLKMIQERIKQRPDEMSYTQPLPRRNPIRPSPRGQMNSSSDDLNSVINQPTKRYSSLKKLNSPMPRNLGTLIQDEKEFDIVSVSSSEWGEVEDPNKLEKVQSQQQLQQLQPQNSQTSTHGSKLSLTSTSTLKANRRHISTSMHNLRNRVLHRPREALASTSSNSEMNNKVERPITPPINDENSIPSKPNISNSRTSLRSRLTSVNKDEPTQLPPRPPQSILNRHGSGNITNSTNAIASKPLDRHISIADTVKTEYTHQESRPESNYNRSSVGDSDDDMDHKPEKPKTGPKRATSLRDIRGSRLSLNSMMSDAKANYGLEITGTIELKLSFNPKTGALHVYIRQCTNLASPKRNQAPNPYCKTYLLPNQSKDSKRKTHIRKGTTNPLFDEILPYHLTLQEFSSRILWVSVWNASSLGHNDFLGEVHIPLSSCKIDELEERPLLPRNKEEKEKQEEEEANAVAQSTAESSELYFELTFIPNTKNKDVGTIEVNKIQAKGIHYGKNPVEAICKAVLMPDKIKRKLPTTRKGPTPKWDIPLRWENIRVSDLKQCSMEISIWNQERFRKTMLSNVRLNSARTHLDSRPVKLLVPSAAEKALWTSFQKEPTRIHRARLTLRPAIIEPK